MMRLGVGDQATGLEHWPHQMPFLANAADDFSRGWPSPGCFGWAAHTLMLCTVFRLPEPVSRLEIRIGQEGDRRQPQGLFGRSR